MNAVHMVSGGPLGGQELEFADGVALAQVDGAKNLAKYELRTSEDEMGNVTEHAVFVGWVKPL